MPWKSESYTCVIEGTLGGEAPTIQCLEPLFANIVSAVVVLAAIVVFIAFIIGGFKYLTGGGDPKKVEEARGTLTAAITGMVLIVAAYIILSIISRFTGIELGIFRVVSFPSTF